MSDKAEQARRESTQTYQGNNMLFIKITHVKQKMNDIGKILEHVQIHMQCESHTKAVLLLLPSRHKEPLLLASYRKLGLHQPPPVPKMA